MVAIQSGQTISGMIKSRNPNISSAELAKLTNQVLKDNNMTMDSARRIPVGTDINLSALEKKPAAEKPAAKPPAQLPQAAPLVNPGAAQTSGLNPFGGAAGGLGSLEALLQQFSPLVNGIGGNRQDLSKFVSTSHGSLNNLGAAANRGGQFLFGLSGGRVLPFANPDIILGNLNLLG